MKTFSVSQINHFVKNVFEDEFVLSNICVVGDACECKCIGESTYFSIKDAESILSCIYFGKLDVQSIEGKKIQAVGRVSFYPKSGKVSFVCRKVDASGQSDKERQLQELKARLSSQGCFDRVVPMPSSIKKVALVTSLEGAVIHDFLRVAEEKNDGVDICIVPVRVQGEESVASLIHALRDVNQYNLTLTKPIDCIVLARGGGSESDLSAFDDEQLVRAVAASKIAVVSAVGHESDHTLCDLAASARAGTPSIAAQMVMEQKSIKPDRIKTTLAALRYGLTRAYDLQRQRVAVHTGNMLYHTHRQMGRLENKVKSTLAGLNARVTECVQVATQRCVSVVARLDGVNPSKLFLQGYAKVQKGGVEVSSATQLKTGDDIVIFMHKGQVEASVQSVKTNDPSLQNTKSQGGQGGYQS
ncbi:MAG: exodeoxyribonuclease VII large subunit [Firmicutes bacterium]|nr:exodeoxyribonuclease VII large subunit [Bacillota bacterium]